MIHGQIIEMFCSLKLAIWLNFDHMSSKIDLMTARASDSCLMCDYACAINFCIIIIIIIIIMFATRVVFRLLSVFHQKEILRSKTMYSYDNDRVITVSQ